MRFTVILFPWQKYIYFQYARNFATLFLFSIIRPLLALAQEGFRGVFGFLG